MGMVAPICVRMGWMCLCLGRACLALGQETPKAFLWKGR